MMDSLHIPSIFYSSGDKKPIKHCSICGKLLLTANEPYIIEKAFKRNSVSKESELIFEYAMCNTCQQKTSNELSKESLANIKMYFDLYVDFEKRQQELGNPTSFKSSDCLKNCIITNKSIEEYTEYQIGGFFYREQILLDYLPFAIGGKAIDELQEVISKKTRDFLNGFKDRILPVDIRDKVPDDFLILI
jgi:predicted nucleic acid-binding Zn ribbon protein